MFKYIWVLTRANIEKKTFHSLWKRPGIRQLKLLPDWRPSPRLELEEQMFRVPTCQPGSWVLAAGQVFGCRRLHLLISIHTCGRDNISWCQIKSEATRTLLWKCSTEEADLTEDSPPCCAATTQTQRVTQLKVNTGDMDDLWFERTAQLLLQQS